MMKRDLPLRLECRSAWWTWHHCQRCGHQHTSQHHWTWSRTAQRDMAWRSKEHLNPKIPNSYSTAVNRYPSLHWKQHFHQLYCSGGLCISNNLKDLFQRVWSISRASSWGDIFDFPFLWKAQLTGPCKRALSHRDTSLSVPRCSHTNHFIVLLLFEEMPIDLELLS